MKFKRFDLPSNDLNIYPLVCHHFGAKQSSSSFIKTVMNEIKKDPLARWIYMGDAGECVTKISKGNIYEQTLNPGDQMRAAIEAYKPIAGKGLFGIRGNHGNRIDKEVGLGWDAMLCQQVGIPYLGVSALTILSTPARQISLYAHHGSSGSIAPAGKMAAAHKAEPLVDTDLSLSAHTHACGEAWPLKQTAYTSKGDRIRWKSQHSFVCGSAYDSRSGYAEEKMYPAITPEHIVIKIRVQKDGTLNVGSHKIRLDVESGKVLVTP